MPTLTPNRRLRRGRRSFTTPIVAVALAVGLSACSSGSSSSTTPAPGQVPSTSGASTGSTPGIAGSTPGTAAAGKTLARYAGFDSAVYAKDENWVCRAGKTDDLCTTENLDTTVVAADGTTTVQPGKRADAPAFDCFYVYPTVNLNTTEPIDTKMAADPAAEIAVTRNQAARYTEQCRVFAPLYRQVTFAGFGAPDAEKLFATAQGDVREAFRYYMAHWNEGRPFVLMGHSQGSGMLGTLMQDEFDGDDDAEVRALLISAILGGGRTDVPVGKDVGGSFQRIPLCRQPSQTGCAIGFNTVALGGTAETSRQWGAAEKAGDQRACTNPASLTTGKGELDAIVANQGTFAPGAAVTTPWVRVTGLLQAECVTAGDITNLRVSPRNTPGDVRDAKRFLEEPSFWGLHITEMGLFQGNLLDIVRQQAAAMG